MNIGTGSFSAVCYESISNGGEENVQVLTALPTQPLNLVFALGRY